MPRGSHGRRWESRPGLTGVEGLERRSNERTCCQGMVGDPAEAEKEARRMPWGGLAMLAAAGCGTQARKLADP